MITDLLDWMKRIGPWEETSFPTDIADAMETPYNLLDGPHVIFMYLMHLTYTKHIIWQMWLPHTKECNWARGTEKIWKVSLVNPINCNAYFPSGINASPPSFSSLNSTLFLFGKNWNEEKISDDYILCVANHDTFQYQKISKHGKIVQFFLHWRLESCLLFSPWMDTSNMVYPKKVYRKENFLRWGRCVRVFYDPWKWLTTTTHLDVEKTNATPDFLLCCYVRLVSESEG